MQSWPTTEELIALAERDPEALETLRQREVAKLIDEAPEHAAALTRLAISS